MRIKTVPEDFQVEELLGELPAGLGPFALYRVEKRNLTTLGLAQALARTLKVRESRVRFPGLKDKKAVAIQHCTVQLPPHKGPKSLGGPGWQAELLRFLPRHLAPKDLKGNRFALTLRDIPPGLIPAVEEKLGLIFRQGVPNYFDLQRFGSWSQALGFPGKALIQGDWEKALRAYLAEPLLGDPSPILRFKTYARENWRNWLALKNAAPKGNLRSVLTFLCDHPEDLKKAVNLIAPRVLSLWLSGYQGFLWNEVASRRLAGIFEKSGVRTVAVDLPMQRLFFVAEEIPADLWERLGRETLPLPAAKCEQSPELRAVLAEEGLDLSDLRARGLRRAYLGRGSRALWTKPDSPIFRWEDDELFPGQEKLILSFSLPPGSYATVLLRFLSEEWPKNAVLASIPAKGDLRSERLGRSGPGEGQGGAQGSEGGSQPDGPLPIKERGENES